MHSPSLSSRRCAVLANRESFGVGPHVLCTASPHTSPASTHSPSGSSASCALRFSSPPRPSSAMTFTFLTVTHSRRQPSTKRIPHPSGLAPPPPNLLYSSSSIDRPLLPPPPPFSFSHARAQRTSKHRGRRAACQRLSSKWLYTEAVEDNGSSGRTECLPGQQCADQCRGSTRCTPTLCRPVPLIPSGLGVLCGAFLLVPSCLLTRFRRPSTGVGGSG
jgi:hypothetical protein